MSKSNWISSHRTLLVNLEKTARISISISKEESLKKNFFPQKFTKHYIQIPERNHENFNVIFKKFFKDAMILLYMRKIWERVFWGFSRDLWSKKNDLEIEKSSPETKQSFLTMIKFIFTQARKNNKNVFKGKRPLFYVFENCLVELFFCILRSWVFKLEIHYIVFWPDERSPQV